jgi:hypothetical protein
MPGVVSHLLKKRRGMVSNLLKRWRDDFATVKKAEGWFRGFSKRNGMPSRLIPPHLKQWLDDIENLRDV